MQVLQGKLDYMQVLKDLISQLKGNTTLEVLLLISRGKARQNKLSTNSLTVKDIKNKAEYKPSNTGLSYTSVSRI